MPLENFEIKTEKVTKNIFKAIYNCPVPKMEITMFGKTAENAKEKLHLFLNNKPYTHLDKI